MKQRHEAQFADPLTHVFSALVEVVAKGRWGGTVLAPSGLPKAGCGYTAQRGKVLRRGKVLECLRPVSMTLQETLLDPPCCVKLRLHWRLEPLESGSFVLLDARYSLNGAASLRRRHWGERIHAHCVRMLGSIQGRLEAGPAGARDAAAPALHEAPGIASGRPSGKHDPQHADLRLAPPKHGAKREA